MKQTITKSMFRDEFNKIRPENFSYEGLGALYDYLEEVDPDYDLDVIAICCDFSEATNEEVLENYSSTIETIDELHEHTVVIQIDNDRLIYQNF